jgi:hypothetical protein
VDTEWGFFPGVAYASRLYRELIAALDDLPGFDYPDKLVAYNFVGTDSEALVADLDTFFNENRAKVLQLVGNLRKEQSMQTADDGVSQKVTVNAGVVKAADVIVRNPVPLTPFRTFREVEQPESPFVLRVNEEARAALFTGDGSAWKLQAVARIGGYLRHNLQGYNVVVIA